MKHGLIFILALFFTISPAFAEPVIKQINYTKKTSLSSSATYFFKLSLWNAETEGDEVWSEEKFITLVGQTLKTYLGDTISLEEVDFSQHYWVQVERLKKDDTYVQMGKREFLGVVPYALWSQSSSESVNPGSHTHSTDDITSGLLSNARLSAYSDLSAEGYLDNDSASDLLIRSQADTRYVNEAQADGVTSPMIQADAVTELKIASGAVTDSKITGPISSSKISSTNLNADTLDGIDSSGFSLSGHSHDDYVDLSTNQAIEGTKTFSDPVASSVVTGTSPFEVSSTTMVTNLNAEMVGNYKIADLDIRYGQSIPLQNPRSNTLTSGDSAGYVGLYSSITIGTDGLPVISYYDATNFDLKVVKCGNAACSANNTITAVDSGGQVGAYTSIAVGADGLPIISYYDGTNYDLKVLKCGNASCSSGNILTSVDSTGDVGAHNSITIGIDGLPVISYYDYTNGNLKVVKCGNPSCSAVNAIVTLDSTGDVGLYTSITMGTDGLPVISYYDYTGGNLKTVKCGNPSCSSGNTITALDSTGDVGQYTSITIGADPFPMISYYDVTNTNLKVVKCGNALCSAGNTITTVDSTGDTGSYSSITGSPDGLPILSYYDGTNYDLKVLKCGNVSCSSGNTATTVDSGGLVGSYTSITVGTDGLPIASYYDGTNGDLKVLKCVNSFCLSNWMRR